MSDDLQVGDTIEIPNLSGEYTIREVRDDGLIRFVLIPAYSQYPEVAVYIEQHLVEKVIPEPPPGSVILIDDVAWTRMGFNEDGWVSAVPRDRSTWRVLRRQEFTTLHVPPDKTMSSDELAEALLGKPVPEGRLS